VGFKISHLPGENPGHDSVVDFESMTELRQSPLPLKLVAKNACRREKLKTAFGVVMRFSRPIPHRGSRGDILSEWRIFWMSSGTAEAFGPAFLGISLFWRAGVLPDRRVRLVSDFAIAGTSPLNKQIPQRFSVAAKSRPESIGKPKVFSHLGSIKYGGRSTTRVGDIENSQLRGALSRLACRLPRMKRILSRSMKRKKSAKHPQNHVFGVGQKMW
jgi:hypothetical protein